MHINLSKREKIFLVILALATFFRLMLSLRLPTLIMADQDYDDRHLMEMAFHLTKMEWLGNYGELTLSKNIAYSFLLAVCYWTMIPYGLMLGFLNIGSAIAFCRAIEPKVEKKVRIVLYLLLLYAPVSFSTLISQRIYRNAVLPYAVLFVFAGFIGLFLRKEKSVRELLPWVIYSGVALTFFWYIKEDSIWILPFTVVITLLILIWMLLMAKVKREEFVKKTILLLVPFLCIIATSLIVSAVNYHYYGEFTTNDRSDSEFGTMMSNIFTIEDDSAHEDRIWVTQSTINQIYKVSPTFCELKDIMDACDTWKDSNGELPGDYIVWQIRYAMALNGYYEEAGKANDFAKQVNDDLEAAFASGQLQRDDKIHVTAQMKGMTWSEIFSYIPKTVKELISLSNYIDCGIDESAAASGNTYVVRKAETFLGVSAEYSIELEDGDTHEMVLEPASKMHSYPVKLANVVVSIYQKLAPVVGLLACLGFVIYVILMIMESIHGNYEKWNMFWILAGIILSAFLVELEVQLFTSFFDQAMYEQFLAFYSASAFPLLMVFKYLSIYLGGRATVEFIRKRKE